VIEALVVLVLASIVILSLNRILRQKLTHLHGRLHMTYETMLVVNHVITAFLWVVTIFIVLNVWGVSLAGIWAVLVSVITVIGVGFLATWTMISNFTANFFLVLWRPFHFGQTVEILPENLTGQVTDLNVMFTTLREDDGSVLRIPNNFFFQKMFRVYGQPPVISQGLHAHDRATLAPEIGDATEK